jgi:thiamine biosynthesis lipoprotein
MATTFRIFTFYEDYSDAEHACSAAFDEIDWLEEQLSLFIPSSDISQINRLRSGRTLRIGHAAYECISLAKKLHDETGGAFDPTAGALISGRRPWDEGADWQRGSVPAEKEEIHVGMDFIELDVASHAIGVRTDFVTVDLGGIGKGYAVDQARTLLDDWGIETALISAGQSTMCGLGRLEHSLGWQMRVLNPQDEKTVLAHFVLPDGAVSTSATDNSQHLVDPRTGEPVNHWSATWAVAQSAALADALSTAFFVMKHAEITAYCRHHHGVKGLLIGYGSNGSPSLSMIGEWRDMSFESVT